MAAFRRDTLRTEAQSKLTAFLKLENGKKLSSLCIVYFFFFISADVKAFLNWLSSGRNLLKLYDGSQKWYGAFNPDLR